MSSLAFACFSARRIDHFLGGQADSGAIAWEDERPTSATCATSSSLAASSLHPTALVSPVTRVSLTASCLSPWKLADAFIPHLAQTSVVVTLLTSAAVPSVPTLTSALIPSAESASEEASAGGKSPLTSVLVPSPRQAQAQCSLSASKS